MKAQFFVFLTVFAVGSVNLFSQTSPGHEFVDFIAANDRFGRALLKEVHAASPDKNIAMSPLPVSYIFGAVSEGSVLAATRQEIIHAFQWEGINLNGPSQLLYERFQPPDEVVERPALKTESSKTAANETRAKFGSALWMRTAFIYRGKNAISRYFLSTATSEFGMDAINIDRTKNLEATRKQWWRGRIPEPTVMAPSDLYAAGMIHLQDVWRGNIFLGSRIHKGDFQVGSWKHKTVDMMPSELGSYRYFRTDSFEAVMLPCWSVYLLVVLPAEGKDVFQIESQLANMMPTLDAELKPWLGDIELPKFRFQFETDLRPSLQKMGVSHVFEDLDIATIPQSRLKEVAQKVEIEVNEQGIRANAGTVMNGIYGGITAGSSPFHMKVNRAFIFLIRDNLTNSLVFIGAVTNPA